MTSPKDWALRVLPPQLRQDAVDLKNALWGGYKQASYSQFGEDRVLSFLLRSPHGYYVDIGANHPKRYSNTHLLYLRGWRGLNVDPNPDAIALFKSARPRDTSVPLGVARESGTATLFRYADPAFNTFSKEAAEALKKKKWLVPLPIHEVAVMPLHAVLERYLPTGTTIDFLNIDVEGNDFDVLQSNDWARFLPHIIAIEDHTFTPHLPEQSQVFSYLVNKGYALKAVAGPTLIFSRQHN